MSMFPEIVLEPVFNTILVDSAEKSGKKIRHSNPCHLPIKPSKAGKLSQM